jgi:hypothetical protein
MNTSDRTYLATAFLSEAGLEKSAGPGAWLGKTIKPIFTQMPGAFKAVSSDIASRWKFRGLKGLQNTADDVTRRAAKVTSRRPRGPFREAKLKGNKEIMDSLQDTQGKALRQLNDRFDPIAGTNKATNFAGYNDRLNDQVRRVTMMRDFDRMRVNGLKDTYSQGMLGVKTLGGLGAIGAGNKALNIAGQMSAPGSDSYQMATNDAWNQAASANRLAMLFNPQGEYQRIAQSLAASAPQKSWTRHLPGFGFVAGNQDAQSKMYQDMAQGMQGMQLPLSARLAYAMNPENTVARMRDYYRQMGYQV